MAINERLVHTTSAAAAAAATGGNQEEGLVLHLDANDVDSYDGDGTEWVDIANHEYKPTTNVSEHFNTVLYTGDGSASGQAITGVGFEPSFLWIADRDVGNYNAIQDSVRGVDSIIFSALTNIEQNASWRSNYGQVTSFNNDGFTVSNGSGNANSNFNQSGRNYVAWCLKAGGAPSGSDKVSIDGTSYSTMTEAGLTDGTEPISKLSVNTKLGFSIVKYTAPALTGDTVAHGLGETPEMIIHKSTSVARNWNVFHKDVGTSKNLHLNATDAGNTSEYWTANSNTFSIQDYSASADWIAYAFTSKRGVSKVGSFVGTNAPGKKIYTGFEPAFVMIKRTSTTGNWTIVDNKRTPLSEYISANLFAGETHASNPIVFERDGFSFTGGSFNQSGQTAIYLAFAKDTNFDDLIDDTDLELHLDAASFDGSTNTPTTWTALTGNNGTITGATFDSELGNYLNLSSDSTYIDVPTANILDSDFTIEMWYNLSSTSNSYKMLLGGSGYQSGTGLGHYVYGDTVKTWVSISGTTTNVLTSSSAITANKWHHIVLKRQGSNWTQYVDGDEVGTATGTTSALSSSNSRIGRHYNTTGLYAAGKSGQVRIYSSALSQAQIRQNYNFTKNDYFNGSNQAINGATFTPGTGSNPDLFRFDGANDSISLDDRTVSSSIHGSDLKGFTGSSDTNYTISFYINTGDSGGNSTFGQPIIGYNSSDVWAALSMKDDKFTYSHYNGSWNHKKSTTSINDSAWHHCVFVHRSDATIDIYVDGTKEVDNVSATLTSGRYYIAQTIGKGYSGEYIDMDFGMLKIYDKALTSSEVTSEFNNTKSTYGLN